MTCLKSATVTPAEVLGRYPPWAFLTTKELAVVLQTDPATLTVWRWRGVGPRPDPSNSRPRYAVAEVVAWLHCQSGHLHSADDVVRGHLADLAFPATDELTPEQLRSIVSALRDDA